MPSRSWWKLYNVRIVVAGASLAALAGGATALILTAPWVAAGSLSATALGLALFTVPFLIEVLLTFLGNAADAAWDHLQFKSDEAFDSEPFKRTAVVTLGTAVASGLTGGLVTVIRILFFGLRCIFKSADDYGAAVKNDFFQLKKQENAEIRKKTVEALEMLTSTNPGSGEFDLIEEESLVRVLQELWGMDGHGQARAPFGLDEDSVPLVEADYAFLQLTNGTTTATTRQSSAACRFLRSVWSKASGQVEIFEEPVEGITQEEEIYNAFAMKRVKARRSQCQK